MVSISLDNMFGDSNGTSRPRRVGHWIEVTPHMISDCALLMASSGIANLLQKSFRLVA